MISKINTDNSFGGNFTNDRIKEDWTTTDVIYQGGFIKAFWDGSKWIESATAAEIEKVITTKIIEEQKIKKENIIKEKLDKMIVEEAQTLTDSSEILASKDLFPFWGVGMDLELNQKVQAFDGVDLKLFKVVQAHTTQADWQPFNNPALFTEIAPPGQVPVWKQPTGAQDAYALDAAVSFEGKYYKSKIAANTYSPTAYPAGWEEITESEAQALV